jgi:hypothetical protein
MHVANCIYLMCSWSYSVLLREEESHFALRALADVKNYTALQNQLVLQLSLHLSWDSLL